MSRFPGLAEQNRQLTDARAAEPWLAGGSVTVQQQALRDLDRAWRNFFAGTHRRPTWRRGGRHEVFRVVGAQALRIRKDNRRWSAVLVPKIGRVKVRRTRDPPDRKSYRITRDRAGRWHLVLAAVPEPVPAPGTGGVVGVDRGVVAAVALSTGELLSPAGLRPKEAERLRRLQRRLARARRGSNRRTEVKQKIARLRAREADRSKDLGEKTSIGLARRFDVIRVEDLRVKNMTRSAKGWGLLVARMEDKAPGRVEQVDPAYTSRTCNACGHHAPENRESQAVFRCVACGHRADADVNAARNIADRRPAAGRAVAARGDRVKSARSVKREPQRARPPRSRSSGNPGPSGPGGRQAHIFLTARGPMAAGSVKPPRAGVRR